MKTKNSGLYYAVKKNMRSACMLAIAVLLMASTLLMTGCSCSGKSSPVGALSSELKDSNLDINDFDWKVDLAKISGKDVYALSLTNNSKYELLGAEIDYKTKAGLSPEQLSVYNDFYNKHATSFKDGKSTADVILKGFEETYIAPGASVSNIPLAIGVGTTSWYDTPSKEQFELMEPSELVLVVVSGDTAYPVYYSFSDQKWRIDAKTTKLNEWPDTEYAKLIPKPSDYTYKVNNYESLGSMNVDVYGVKEENYKEYIEQLKNKGFTEDVKEESMSSRSTWEAKDKNGNEVEVELYPDKCKMKIELDSK